MNSTGFPPTSQYPPLILVNQKVTKVSAAVTLQPEMSVVKFVSISHPSHFHGRGTLMLPARNSGPTTSSCLSSAGYTSTDQQMLSTNLLQGVHRTPRPAKCSLKNHSAQEAPSVGEDMKQAELSRPSAGRSMHWSNHPGRRSNYST